MLVTNEKRREVAANMRDANTSWSKLPCTIVLSIYGVQKGFCKKFNDCNECAESTLSVLADLIEPKIVD